MADDLIKIQKKIQGIPAPRSLKFRKPGRGELIYFMILIGIYMVPVFWGHDVVLTWVTCHFGGKAEAKVLKKKTWNDIYQRNGIKIQRYGFDIAYPDPGLKHSLLAEVTREYWMNVKEGDKIVIRYINFLPGYPFVQLKNFWGLYFLSAAYFCLILMCAGYFYYTYNLLSKGDAVIGDIFRVIETGKSNTEKKIVYKYNMNSKITTDKVYYVYKDDIPKHALILVDPLNSKHAMLYDKDAYWWEVIGK